MLLYILLGIIQGIFEWIPISSEGIVALISQFLIQETKPIDIALFLHLGTFFAVLIYFRKDWIKVLTFKDKKLLKFLIISTIFSLIIGYPLYILVSNATIGSLLLLITGFGLMITAYFHKKKINLKINFNQLAVVAGILQGLAVIPGLSRSGSTIFGLSLKEKNPSEVLRISYMMSAPIVLASSVFLILEKSIFTLETGLSLIFSFVVGFLSLKILIKLSQRIDFFKFALIFSLLCLIGGILTLFY